MHRPPWQHLAIEYSNCLNGKTSSNSYEGLIFHYQIRFCGKTPSGRSCCYSEYVHAAVTSLAFFPTRFLAQEGTSAKPDLRALRISCKVSGVQKKKQLTLGRVEGQSPKLPAVE